MVPLIVLSSLCMLARAGLIPRQATSLAGSSVAPGAVTTSSAYEFWPEGVQDASGTLESTTPLPCAPGCNAPANAYYSCFINRTWNGDDFPADPEACNAYLCQQGNYNNLLACLDCIIANGNERPFGYATNSSIGTEPSTSTSDIPGGLPERVQGYMDADLANGWLKNVTDTCRSAGLALSGVESTVTATPTTTGPFLTEWSASETVNLNQWTGLTEYGTPTAILLTAGASVPSASGGVSAISAPAASGTSNASGTAPAASQTGGAASSKRQPGNPWTWEWVAVGLAGLIAALAR